MRHGGLQPSSTARGKRRRAAHWRASGAAGNGWKARRDELLDGALEQASTFSFVFYFLFVELYIIYLLSFFSFIFSV